jgi:8-oxo-dGTP pyrophosphatase MutT (NUDIX family)
MSDIAEPRPAATVVLLRDGDTGPETLLLKRNKALAFAGGLWVFPGGALDPEDWAAAANDEFEAARIACAREAQEEAGLLVDSDTMVQISHWTTPEAEKKRFYTWIFLSMTDGVEAVEIDGSEIHDHQWVNVREAVAQHEAGELGLLPPTIMTLRALVGYLSAQDAMHGIAARNAPHILPVFARAEDVVAVLFPGDAGYESGDALMMGSRNRVQMADGCWHYGCEDLDPAFARMDV